VIRNIGTKRHPLYALYSKAKTRRLLGVHESLDDVAAQERAIQISKARAAGHDIPRRRSGK